MVKIENEAEIAKLIDLDFLRSLCEKYEIADVQLGDDDPFFPMKDDIARIRWGICSGRYHLELNSKVDKEKMARYLSLRTRLKIKPDEVYYYAVLHEIGHIYDKESPYNASALFARPFFLNQTYPLTEKIMTWDQIRADRIEAEKIADKFAKEEFKKWRKKKKI